MLKLFLFKKRFFGVKSLLVKSLLVKPVTNWVEFCHNLGFWVLSQFEFLSFMRIWVFQFHHNLSLSFYHYSSFFSVSSDFEFLGFIRIWVLEFHQNLSFWVIRIWVEIHQNVSFWVSSEFEFFWFKKSFYGNTSFLVHFFLVTTVATITTIT